MICTTQTSNGKKLPSIFNRNTGLTCHIRDAKEQKKYGSRNKCFIHRDIKVWGHAPERRVYGLSWISLVFRVFLQFSIEGTLINTKDSCSETLLTSGSMLKHIERISLIYLIKSRLFFHPGNRQSF